jgi:hypothetical protein
MGGGTTALPARGLYQPSATALFYFVDGATTTSAAAVDVVRTADEMRTAADASRREGTVDRLAERTRVGPLDALRS